VAAQPASLVAKFESGEVRLSTTIRLRDTRMPILVGADVVGDVLGDRVAVRVAPGREFSQCVFIDGDVGDLAIDLTAAVSSDLESGEAHGTIGGHPVRLEASRLAEDRAGRSVRGDWAGPSSICLMSAASLL